MDSFLTSDQAQNYHRRAFAFIMAIGNLSVIQNVIVVQMHVAQRLGSITKGKV